MLPLAFIPLSLTLLLPPPLTLLGFFLFPAYYVTRWKTRDAALPALQANVPILILLLGVLIGLLISPAREAGALGAARLLAGITTFYVLHDVLQTPAHVWRATGVLVAAALGLVLLLPFTVGWSTDKVFSLPSVLEWTLRPPGQGTNPNIVAGLLALALPLAFVLLYAPERSLKGIGAVSLGPIMVGLLILQSRGAWFAALGGLAIAAALYRRWLVPVLPLFVLAVLFVNQQMGGGAALSDVLFGKIGRATEGTLIERQQLWSQAVDLLRAQPLFGIGMGAYPLVAPYAPPYSQAAPGLAAPHAHNIFLQVALDAGLLGFVGFVGVMLLAFAAAWRARNQRVASPLPLGILAALAVVVLHGMADSVFWGLRASGIVWYLFALALALGAAARDQSQTG